jgi:2-oxoglutarate ferredoxin oxidoreductase subunit gamma
MVQRYEIRLSGSGGQGLILAGLILAEAVALKGRRHVVQSQSYGPEARGTASKTDIIISDEEIDYPKALHLDVLLAMNQKALDINFLDLKEKGLLVVDSDLVQDLPTTRAVSLPLTALARETTGSPLPANMAALGALAILTQQVSLGALTSTLVRQVKKESLEMNLRALKAGARYAKRRLSHKAAGGTAAS